MTSKKVALLVLFIFQVFTIDRSMDLILNKASSSSQIRFSRLYNGSINADIVMLGNSRGVNAFYAPAMEKNYKIRAFNLSFNGMSMDIAAVLWEDFLKYNKKPSVVAIEISCITMGDTLLHDLKQYIDDSSLINEKIQTNFPSTYYTQKIFKTYKYNSEFFFRTLYYLNKTDQTWINRYKISKEYYDTLKRQEKSQIFFTISETGIDCLKKIIALAKKMA